MTRWVKDRPPDNGEDFLVVGSNGKMCVCHWYHHPNGQKSLATRSENEVHWDKIDWMPLPTPPKEQLDD